jgi:DNA repair protein RecN (Recombination protein N)
MLSELRVCQLGVIEDLTLALGPGMTAVTGETGAGKTLVVEAIELLVGGRAEGIRVRGGSPEATVEGRFIAPDGGEVVVSRVVPVEGRSRAYVDGRMAAVGTLAEVGEGLVDLHGQHSHQSLLSASAQREALDRFARADHRPRAAALARVGELVAALASAGGDAAGRAREAELLTFQLSELGAARVVGAAEDEALATEEERLARAAAHREAAARAYEGLAGEEQVLDRLGSVVASMAGHPPLDGLHARLRGLEAELADAASDAREAAESLQDDPARLAEVVARRALLRELCRKYAGPGGGLAEVMAFEQAARQRLAELEGWVERAAQLERSLREASADLRRAAAELGRVRRGAAASLGRAVEEVLRRLAMPGARFEVAIGREVAIGGPVAAADLMAEPDVAALAGDEVTFLLAANPGEALLPLSKVASGGELARAMLALRLVLSGLSGTIVADSAGSDPGRSATESSEAPRTLVFDEVDAGIGGQAAVEVGRALAALGRQHQVIVVTHLPQVAAYADAQIAVTKVERGGRSVAVARVLDADGRVVELSRMLSGQPGSDTARRHAKELLANAQSKG